MSEEKHCFLCDDTYREKDEPVWGVGFEKLPGKEERVYLCWECAIWLYNRLHAHVESYAYQFLFRKPKRKRPANWQTWLEASALPVDERKPRRRKKIGTVR